MQNAKTKYNRQKALAKYRGIDFLITFEEWYQWWLDNGVDKNVDTFDKQDANRLCMCRNNDSGPYSIDNIYCATHIENVNHMKEFSKQKHENTETMPWTE